ncbi:uncharacterized protein SCHCODRAFT_02634380 [Schizophyllum commune H4-8]|nr:uncharacterized protein SCHCODRAFT_02634380 [Schizophyllum commune H4-8]KAI5889391.1 hypothetical protein SCHCODRAFT_02634380 [Schizophyllum commune H4-8]
MTVAMANTSGTANTHPSRGRSQGGLNPPPAAQPKSGGLLRSVSGVFKRDKSVGGSSRPRRPAQNDFTNKESREAALRAYGLLPQPDMSQLEKQRDRSVPSSPDPNQAHNRAESLSTAERIKQEYKSKAEVDNKSRMQDFKFGGATGGTSLPRKAPPPGIEPISEDSPSRWRAQKEIGAAAEVIFPKRAAPRSASSDSLLDEAIGQAISTPMGEAVGQAISTPEASPKPPPSPSREMKTERRRGRPSYPAPDCALPLPPPSTGLDIADSLTDSLSRHRGSPNPSFGGESPNPPPSTLPSLPERDSSSPEASESPKTPPSAHTSPALDQAATRSPADKQHDAALDVILDAYDYGDSQDAPIIQGSVDIKRSWSQAARGKPGIPLPDVPPPPPEGGVRRRKTLNPFRRGREGDGDGEASSGGKFSRSKSLMRPRGEGRRARNRSVDVSRERSPARTAVAPTIHTQGTVMQDVHRIKDDESRQLTEMAFM